MEVCKSVILVTSAGSPLGETLIEHFLSLGAQVVATDSDETALSEIAERYQSIYDKLLLLPTQGYTDQSIKSLFDRIEHVLGCGIDVLINYWQSPTLPSLMSDLGAEDLSQQLSKLTSPMFAFGQSAAEHMKSKERDGVIVNMITSGQAKEMHASDNVSSLVSGFTHSWAKELTPFNIRVGGVVPATSHFIKNEEQQSAISCNRAAQQDELIRSTEYIVTNKYFSGRVISAEA